LRQLILHLPISQTIQPTQEQALVSRQLATLVDRQHYLNMRLDANTSNRILDMYLDSLDPDHSYFWLLKFRTIKQNMARLLARR
jgi:hypothetical protein